MMMEGRSLFACAGAAACWVAAVAFDAVVSAPTGGPCTVGTPTVTPYLDVVGVEHSQRGDEQIARDADAGGARIDRATWRNQEHAARFGARNRLQGRDPGAPHFP